MKFDIKLLIVHYKITSETHLTTSIQYGTPSSSGATSSERQHKVTQLAFGSYSADSWLLPLQRNYQHYFQVKRRDHLVCAGHA